MSDTYPLDNNIRFTSRLWIQVPYLFNQKTSECAVSITDEFGGLDGDSLSVTMLNSGPVFTSEMVYRKIQV